MIKSKADTDYCKKIEKKAEKTRKEITKLDKLLIQYESTNSDVKIYQKLE